MAPCGVFAFRQVFAVGRDSPIKVRASQFWPEADCQLASKHRGSTVLAFLGDGDDALCKLLVRFGSGE